MAPPETAAGAANSVFRTLVEEHRVGRQTGLTEQAHFERTIVVNRARYEEKGAGTLRTVKSRDFFSRIIFGPLLLSFVTTLYATSPAVRVTCQSACVTTGFPAAFWFCFIVRLLL